MGLLICPDAASALARPVFFEPVSRCAGTPETTAAGGSLACTELPKSRGFWDSDATPMTRTAFASRPLRVVDTDAYASAPAPSTDEELFSRYAPYVGRIGLRLLGREPEVDDLIQDVFLVAFKKRGQLRDPNAAKAWLATIAVRIARKHLRRRRLRRFVGLDHEPSVELIDPAVSPEKRALLSRLYEILDRMDVDCRLAWTLRYVEGETLEGVALRCGCSLATAKRRVSAAHTLLGGEVSRG